jgi:hypothetical protein
MITADIVHSAESRCRTVEAARELIFLFDDKSHIWTTFL